MPLYSFENIAGDIQDLFYSMKDVPSVGAEIDIDGVKWKRVFTKPNAAISTTSDPYSAKDFNKRLDGKNVTVGNMWEASAEASAKRESKDGVDPIKKKYYDGYAKERKGARHPNEGKENMKKDLAALNNKAKELGISVKTV